MKEILEIIDLEKHYPPKTNDRFKQLLDPDILFTRYQTYRDPEPIRAVDGVNFSIFEGECVGLVGESGSGKSTLGRMIARLIDPSQGQIRYLNRDVSLISARNFAQDRYRRSIQMVFQDPNDSLNPTFTAFRTIAEPLKCIEQLRDKPSLEKRVDALADQVGLPRELLSRYPHQLSGGQKARVGIARAIALKPALLLLDEPTTALDVSVQAIILKLLDDLRKQLNMSYLFITHDLHVVRLLSDRILVMKTGKIVEQGTVDQIFQSPQHAYTQALLKAIPQP